MVQPGERRRNVRVPESRLSSPMPNPAIANSRWKQSQKVVFYSLFSFLFLPLLDFLRRN